MNPFLGQIIMFGGNFAPRGWALCEGQLLAISTHQALFSLLGTIYGGDGRTTFALPDLRGRTPVGFGAGPGLTNRMQGERGGLQTTTLQNSNLPAHNHAAALKVSSANATQSAATDGASIATPGALAGRTFTPTEGFNTGAPDITMNTQSVETVNSGGGQAFNNMQPYLAINYIIALEGTFPSRS